MADEDANPADQEGWQTRSRDEKTDGGPDAGEQRLLAPDLVEAYGENLFTEALARFLQPELKARLQAGEWDAQTGVYAFQVLLPFEGDVEVRVNEEVGGTAEVEAKPGKTWRVGDEYVFSLPAGLQGFGGRGRSYGACSCVARMSAGSLGLGVTRRRRRRWRCSI